MKTVLFHLKTPAWGSIKKAGDMYPTVNFVFFVYAQL
jgi:hypothetical protein